MTEAIKYQEPSNVGNFYLKHVDVMKPLEDQPEKKSFAVSKEGYSLQLLREIAESKSVNKKVFVVIEWPEVFEVQRLPDGSNAKLFYRYCTNAKYDCTDSSMVDIENIICQYIKSDLESCLKYDKNLTPEIKNENIISYTYLHRRCASLASFRKSANGSTELLKILLKMLSDNKIIEAVSNDIATGMFKTTAKLYKVVDIELLKQ